MFNQKKLTVSHAPFWHDGGSISSRHYHIMLAALIAVIPGLAHYGGAAMAVVCFSIATAVFWECVVDRIAKRPLSVGDGNAALIGLLLAMLLPAGTPWWIVLIGTFLAVVIGKQIFGGIGANPFNPVLLSVAMLSIGWKNHMDFNEALVAFDLKFSMAYPLTALKAAGPAAVAKLNLGDLFLGQQPGGIGATCGLALVIGGLYLILRGFIRWEISVTFIAGVIIAASLFKVSHPDQYMGPIFHLVTGYTLIGAFFLATEDSSSPVNLVPMLIYGAGCGIMTVMIRNIGAFADGVVYAILVMNLVQPLIDKIRPKTIGKVAAK